MPKHRKSKANNTTFWDIPKPIKEEKKEMGGKENGKTIQEKRSIRTRTKED